MIKKIMLEDTEPGQFFVYEGDLYLASEDMETNIRIKDGKVCKFWCDETEVATVSGINLRRALAA